MQTWIRSKLSAAQRSLIPNRSGSPRRAPPRCSLSSRRAAKNGDGARRWPRGALWGSLETFTIWLFNIAMENGPSIDGLPIKNGDFPWLC